VARRLPADHLSALAEWPSTLRLEVSGLGPVLFCHATPRSDSEIFTLRTPEDRLRPLFEGTGAAVVVCGHTHMPFDRTVGRVRVVNAGSVGMPFGAPGASWALLGPDVTLRHTTYDVRVAAERLRATGYPERASMNLGSPPPERDMLEMFERRAWRPDP
jgi:diadenosine tetraphosphatase ApaH/serine/threonine PP2A family protein phosphatase